MDALVRVVRADPDTALRAKAFEVLRGFGSAAAARLKSLEVELQAHADQEEASKRAASVQGLQLEMANPSLNRRD